MVGIRLAAVRRTAVLLSHESPRGQQTLARRRCVPYPLRTGRTSLSFRTNRSPTMSRGDEFEAGEPRPRGSEDEFAAGQPPRRGGFSEADDEGIEDERGLARKPGRSGAVTAVAIVAILLG